MSDQEPRDLLHEAVEATHRALNPHLEDAHLIKWVSLVDWLAPNGERLLSLVEGQANGDGLASWDIQGMLFNVLHDHAWLAGETQDLDDD